MSTSRLLPLALLLAAGCSSPGQQAVTIQPQKLRMDVASADIFRLSSADRKSMIKKLVIADRTVFTPGTADPTPSADARGTRILLQDAQYNAWLSEFEREFISQDIHVMDRHKLEELISEQDINPEEAARLLGADALFQINVLEVLEIPRPIDLRLYNLNQRVSGKLHPIERMNFLDFYCRIDAKLILSDGVVVWSGEINYPASSLAESITLLFDLIHKDDEGASIMRQSGQRPNPFLELIWKPEMADVSMLSSLPSGIRTSDLELVRIVTKFAAKRTVGQIFVEGS